MNRLSHCSVSKNYRYMLAFAITSGTQYTTFYLTIKVVAGKMALTFYDPVYTANASLCTGLIFSFVSRNIFPYFHLYHLEIRQATKNAAHRYYLINSELIFRSEIVCLRYMFSPNVIRNQARKSSSSSKSAVKSSAADDLPPRGSPSLTFWMLPRPQAIPRLPFELNA